MRSDVLGVLTTILTGDKNKAKAIEVCVNRFDDETKQAFMELYDKVDADFEMENKEDKNDESMG